MNSVEVPDTFPEEWVPKFQDLWRISFVSQKFGDHITRPMPEETALLIYETWRSKDLGTFIIKTSSGQLDIPWLEIEGMVVVK